MPELEHTGSRVESQGQRQTPQTASDRHVPVFVTPRGQRLWLQKEATRGRVGLSTPKAFARQHSLRNSLSRQFHFATALGVRTRLHVALFATAALCPIAF
jgi:hypothetical protein